MSSPNPCPCTPSCPPLTQLDPTIPGVTILRGSPFIDINGIAGGSANGLVLIGLVGDSPSPGNSKYYGTNGAGTPGFYSLPVGSVTSIATADSITGGPITGSGTINLVNDQASPGGNAYYGTDMGGTKGWFSLPSGLVSPLTTKGDIFARSTVDSRFAVGTDGQIIVADSSQAIGLRWTNNTALITSYNPAGTDLVSTTVQAAISEVDAKTVRLTTKGDLLSFSTVVGRVPVGSDGQVLVADSTQTFGVKWASTPRRIISTTSVTFGASPYLLLNTDEVLEVATSGGAITINLALGGTYTTRQVFYVKDVSNNAAINNITINATGGQTIDGAPNLIININSGDTAFYWNGTQWLTL